MPITNIRADDAWSSRPAIKVSDDPNYDFEIRASVGSSGCDLQRLYEGGGVEPTDELPLATKLLFAWGLSAESEIDSDLKKKGFVPAVDDGAQVVYRFDVIDGKSGLRVLVYGTADGLYVAPKENDFGVPEGELVAIEMKTTRRELFDELSRPAPSGKPMGNLRAYSRQSALHALGCEVDHAGIVTFDRNDPWRMRRIPLTAEAIAIYTAEALGEIRRAARQFKAFIHTGETPVAFNYDRSVRKGYCSGCRYRSMCHPDGIKMRATKTDKPESVPAVSDLSITEFADKIRRVVEMKSVVSALNKVVNAETAELREFARSKEYTELSVPVSLVDDDSNPLVGETLEHYAGIKSDVLDLVEMTLDKHSANPTGYAHISVKESSGRPSVPAENMPAVIANMPDLVSMGRPSTRTVVSRKAKPLTQKAIDAQETE